MKHIIIISILFSLNCYSQGSVLEWAKQVGDSASNGVSDMCRDTNGNLLITGVYDPTSIYTWKDIATYKLDSLGNVLWQKTFTGNGMDHPYSITTDAYNNVYSVGVFEQTIDFDPGPDTFNLTNTSIGDIYIQKLDTDGNFIWAKQIGNNYYNRASSISVDSNNDIYITGRYVGMLDFDPGLGTEIFGSVSGEGDIFILKLDADGNYLWVKLMGGPFINSGEEVISDMDNNIYVTGFFDVMVDFDPGPDTLLLETNGNKDIFLQKLDQDGELLWVQSMGGSGNDRAYSLDLDNDGNIYVTGIFDYEVDFNPANSSSQILSSYGEADIFIQKFDPEGNLVWVKQLGSVNDDFVASISCDSENNVLITGTFSSLLNFSDDSGLHTISSNGLNDAYILKLDSEGNLVYFKQVGGDNSEWGVSILTDDLGNTYLSGVFSDITDFDTVNDSTYFSAMGSADIFVTKFNSCQNSYNQDAHTACNSFTWINGVTYFESNSVANYFLLNSVGCDSVVTLDLIINEVSDLVTTINGGTITANNSDATSFQWLDCDLGMTAIAGETNADFAPSISGNYAVEISEFGCTDTSDCASITILGLSSYNYLIQPILYPNPTNGAFQISLEQNAVKLNMRVISVTGKIILNKTYSQVDEILVDVEMVPGIYFVELENEHGAKAFLRLVVG